MKKLYKIGQLEDAYEKLEDAYEKLKSMLDKGLCAPGHVRDAFKHAFEKYGKLKIAQEFLDRVDQVQKSDEQKLDFFSK